MAEELGKWIYRVDIPAEILTDQGMNFISQVVSELYQDLGIKYLRMVKQMLRNCAQDNL